MLGPMLVSIHNRGPGDYDYIPGYYAVFFADPDGIKLEYAHIPGQT